LATRRELIEAIAGRYHAATRIEKKKILDEFIKVTGFHRKHGIRALKRHTGMGSESAPRARIYDEAAVTALTISLGNGGSDLRRTAEGSDSYACRCYGAAWTSAVGA
jgi:hypothetical protein